MESLVKARSHENQYFMVTVDRSGSDPNTRFYGKSVISNPFAEDVAERNEIYSYAELNKEDIVNISKLLPLGDSFKYSYKLEETG
jgi:predicted amidohydrolase